MKFVYSSLSKTGLLRNTNEDAVGVFEYDDGIIIIVCDGLGGNNAGEVASQMTVDIINKYFTSSDETDYLERIKNSIIEANRIVLQSSENNTDFKGMATTVEVLFLQENTAYWAHVGDSRIYHLRNKKLKQLTKDHSLVQKLVDEGFLTLKEAENHPNKNIIIRALGDNPVIEVDISKLRFNSDDETVFFICTDGVTAVINDFELEEILSLKNKDQISQKISRTVEERGAPDNYSFVIISKFE
ncbi:MAG: Stp1/IreP family PP2C-type Ser/Thr phosphatase [Ignavibacteriaceae bacterium]